jgi:hypothetical protein
MHVDDIQSFRQSRLPVQSSACFLGSERGRVLQTPFFTLLRHLHVLCRLFGGGGVMWASVGLSNVVGRISGHKRNTASYYELERGA